ncbi:MAG TPA: ribonucleoside-diphosphate reductase, adenosylcobalamin-dependent, partial [Caldisericia bacterium]|nr:ribonucleoside-diphosphate reductase, adenosylcobalamin-dependent [Caldisericia bacterium]
MYSENEVKSATLEYFNGDTLATDVWMKKYALKNKNDEYLEKNPDDMHRRLASEFHRVESKYPFPLTEEEIFSALKDFKHIVPQGSPMSGIGNIYSKQSLSNCVVVASPEDNMSSIFDKGKELANLFKNRCGVGMDMSKLRPEGTPVNNSAKTSTGAWSFCDLYSNITRMIGQNNRRGALMLTMDIRHPDIFKFVTMKHDLTKVTGANISVKISDEFMNAVKEDKNFILRFPVTIPSNEKMDMEYNVRYNFDDGMRIKIKAKELWKVITESATQTAEPGILMWDNILRRLPAESYNDFKTICTNPCGE